MTTLSKEQIEKIRAEAEEATKGPWIPYRCSYANEHGNPPHGCGINGHSWDCSYDECHHPVPLNDLKFIASSRTNVPELCNTALELMDRVKELEEALELWMIYYDTHSAPENRDRAYHESARILRTTTEARRLKYKALNPPKKGDEG